MTPFLYDKRVTLMPVISASGEAGPCLFVFKGARFPYRSVLEEGQERIDTIAHHLPYLSVPGMREEGGGVDSKNFLLWARHFVEYVSPFTQRGKKVLLIYDGYRSHMSFEILDLFLKSNIIVYALPAHSSGRLQPLDVVSFSAFKRSMNDVVHNSVDCVSEIGAKVFDFYDMLRTAYTKTFTPNIIRKSFLRADICPLDPHRLMEVPRPMDGNLDTIATVEQMEETMKQRRDGFANTVFGKRVSLLSSGYIDNTEAAVLTSVEAMKKINEKAIALEKAKKVEQVHKERRQQRAALRLEASQKTAALLRE